MIFFSIVVGGIEFGIAWLVLEDGGVYDPDLLTLIATIAEPLQDLDPEFRGIAPEVLVFGNIAVIALALTIYFLPTINARRRAHPQSGAIFLINLLFGLSGIFWLVALIWSALGGAAKPAQQTQTEEWRKHLKTPKKAQRKSSSSPKQRRGGTAIKTEIRQQSAVQRRDLGPTVQRR